MILLNISPKSIPTLIWYKNSCVLLFIKYKSIKIKNLHPVEAIKDIMYTRLLLQSTNLPLWQIWVSWESLRSSPLSVRHWQTWEFYCFHQDCSGASTSTYCYGMEYDSPGNKTYKVGIQLSWKLYEKYQHLRVHWFFF